MRFHDRADAGRRLADRLRDLRAERPVVVALPRGGVPVAAEIARAIGSPLDVLVVRKLGHPLQPELGVGAIAEGGAFLLNRELIAESGVDPAALQRVVERERAELARRVGLYRGDRPRIDVSGRTVVLVDDGLATGFTARAAIEVLHAAGAQRVVLAIPVAPLDTIRDMRTIADEVVCLETPAPFRAIGEWYEDFSQLSDADVASLLKVSVTPRGPRPDRSMRTSEVEVLGEGCRLDGTLSVPSDAPGLVLFAHGSGSSRFSPRNRFVAEVLNRAGIATLLLDLLTEAESEDRRNVFDIGLLADRLALATAWCRTQDLPAQVGYFGASTGAAAALVAAAQPHAGVAAVVSRGGRPDLASRRLSEVAAPTLLIVGGNDREVLELNRRAAALLTRCEHRLVVVPGATHLFEEPGALELAADLAADWFATHLQRAAAQEPRRSSA